MAIWFCLSGSVGKRLLCHDWIGRYTRAWDPLDRIQVSKNPYGGTLTFTWDAASHRRRLVDPLGGLTTTVYDAAGRLSRLVDPQDGRTTYAYDPAGRRTEKRLANGTRTSFSYDAADRLTQVDNLTSAGSSIAGFAYAYDPAGNRVGVVESAGDRVTWTYDAANQLTSEHRTGVSGFRHTFAYDPAGNRTLKNEDGDRTTFTYDPANRLHRSAVLSGLTTYVYDAAGNQRTVEEPTGDVVTNTWSYENQNTLDEQPTGDRVRTHPADAGRSAGRATFLAAALGRACRGLGIETPFERSAGESEPSPAAPGGAHDSTAEDGAHPTSRSPYPLHSLARLFRWLSC